MTHSLISASAMILIVFLIHDVRVRANDSEGNMANWDTRYNITIDRTPPIATLDYPFSFGNITANNYTLNATVIDTLSPISYAIFEYRSSGIGSFVQACVDNDSQEPFSCNWNTTLLVETDTYQIRVRANDTLSNIGDYNTHTNITIDGSGPLIYLESPRNNTYSIGNMTFFYNTTDLHSILNCSLVFNATLNQTNSSITKGISQNFSSASLRDNDILWSIRCYDNYGNSNTTESRLIHIDNTPPVATLSYPRTFENISKNFVVNASVIDTGAGVNVTTFEYRENNNKDFAVACKDTDGSAPYSCTWTVAALNDTFTYEFRVYANDSLGNNGTYDTHLNITLDRTPPLISTLSPPNETFTTSDITFKYETTDLFRSISNCSLVINSSINWTNTTVAESIDQNFTSTNFADGLYTWAVKCYDDLGNFNTSKSRNITVDTSAPSVNLTNPIHFDNISSANYTVSAVVLDSGIGVNSTLFEYRNNATGAWLQICVDNNAPYSCSWNTGALDENISYQVRVIANDSLGTLSSYINSSNITLDRTFPALTLITPENSTQDVDGNNILFVYNTSDAMLGIENCSLVMSGKINKTNLTVAEDVYNNFTLDTVGYNNYTWYVNCSDSAGNTNKSETRKLIVAPDTDAPVIDLIAPEDNNRFAFDDITLQYNVTDVASGIKSCNLVINSSLNISNQTLVVEGSANSFTLYDLPDGDYTWNVNCTDDSIALKTGNSTKRNFTVQEASTINILFTSNHEYYEKEGVKGEIANFSVQSTDLFANNLKTNMTFSIIHSNNSIPWWNGSFIYREPVNITPMHNFTLPGNYTINYTINTQQIVSDLKMQSNGNDLRMVYWDNATNTNIELDRIITNVNAVQTSVLFRTYDNIANISSNPNYYVYHGYSSAPAAPSNLSKVMFYLDNFDSNTINNYNTTKGFNDPDEDLDSTLSFLTGTIKYTGTSGQGKSIRMSNYPIRDVSVKAHMNMNSLPGGSRGFYEVNTCRKSWKPCRQIC